jgi:formylglycine-generating enzyme required for sulfatase activity
MKTKLLLVIAACLALGLQRPNPLMAAQMPTGEKFTNSIGMKFVRITPGSFEMGNLTELVTSMKGPSTR